MFPNISKTTHARCKQLFLLKAAFDFLLSFLLPANLGLIKDQKHDMFSEFDDGKNFWGAKIKLCSFFMI